MFCQDCGTELADESKFCSKCGKRQGHGIDASADSSLASAVYEVCDTEYQFIGRTPISIIGSARVKFLAAAISPKNGRYTAAESAEFNTRKIASGREVVADFNTQKHQAERDAAFGDMVSKLIADGWERTQSGQGFYRQSFRRRVT